MTKRPWRPRAEVFILKGKKKVVLGQPFDWKGYIVPGGGIDKGETPKQAAKRETLEELGIRIKDLVELGSVKIPYQSTTSNTKPHILEMIQKYSGAEFKTYMAQYDGIDPSLWNKENDGVKPVEVEIPVAIKFFEQHARNMIQDKYNHKKALHTVSMLKEFQKNLKNM